MTSDEFGSYNTQITVERKSVTRDSVYRTEIVSWVPLVSTGSPPVAVRFWAEVVDLMPSRSDSVRQGLAQARNQTRIRLPWRGDIDSTMRVTVHRDTDVVYHIVGGPAEIEGRRRKIEMVVERYSTGGG